MDFEKSLLRGIPLAEAAGFFTAIMGTEKRAQAELETLAKEANGAMPPPAGATPLPPTAKGQNMQPSPPPALPPTAMGMQSKMGSKTPQEAGESRARANFAAAAEHDRLTRGERALGTLGGLGGMLTGGGVGGAGGAVLMDEVGHALPQGLQRAGVVAGMLGGAYLGHRAGKAMGGGLGHAVDMHRFRGLPAGGAPVSEMPEKAAAAFKLALSDLGMAPAGIEPQLDPQTQAYLENEAAAEQETEAASSAFLRQKLQEAQAEMQSATERAQTLEQQQAMHDAQLQQFQTQVADSTQKAMAAQDQVLQNQQAAAAMRMAYQQLRGTLLTAASSDPPSLTPGAPGADAAQAQMSQDAGSSSAPAPQAGPAGQAPNPGVPPAGMAPTGDDTVSTPAAKNEPTFEGAQSTTKTEQQEPQGDAKTPNKEVLSHYLPFAGKGGAKVASLGEYLGTQAAKLVPRLPHAAVGAALGAGAGATEAFTSNEPLRQRVQGLEAKPDRGLGDAVNLAQSRARLTMGEFAKEHPGTMMGAGALSGALAGLTEGPGVVSAARGLGSDLGAIGKNVKSMFNKGAA